MESRDACTAGFGSGVLGRCGIGLRSPGSQPRRNVPEETVMASKPNSGGCSCRPQGTPTPHSVPWMRSDDSSMWVISGTQVRACLRWDRASLNVSRCPVLRSLRSGRPGMEEPSQPLQPSNSPRAAGGNGEPVLTVVSPWGPSPAFSVHSAPGSCNTRNPS